MTPSFSSSPHRIKRLRTRLAAAIPIAIVLALGLVATSVRPAAPSDPEEAVRAQPGPVAASAIGAPVRTDSAQGTMPLQPVAAMIDAMPARRPHGDRVRAVATLQAFAALSKASNPYLLADARLLARGLRATADRLRPQRYLTPLAWVRSRATPASAPSDAIPPEVTPRSDEAGISAEPSSRRSLVRLNLDLSGVNRSSTAYTRFKSWVDSAVNGSPGYDFHAADAAIMFLLTREVRYCTLGVNLVEAQVAAAEADIGGGGVPDVAGDSYLEVGPMIADLSTVYQTCSAHMTSAQRQRWASYAEQAVWNVWNPDRAVWGGRSSPWSGWSIDNPGNNYHYSFIEATMSWALASGSASWFDLLSRNKLPAMQAYYAKIPGGGSLEGTGYGTAQKRLFDIYGLWRKSTGQDASSSNTHARKTIDYWVHATVPSMDRFAPLGDQSRNSVPELYDYHRHLVLAARYLTMDAEARSIASWWLRSISVPQMGQGANLRYDLLLPAGSGGAPPTARYYAAQGTGHVFARSGWDTNAMWMSFVAGPYNESHAHQEQGGFTLFSRGDWLAVTENIWSHSGIQQGTETHNVLRFERSNPSASQCAAPSGDRIVHQCEPTTSTATVTPGANGALTINANLTPAYRGNPALVSWRRRVDFAGRKLTVLDNFALGSGTTAYFQVNVPVQPTIVDARTVRAGGLRIRVLQPANPQIRLVNWTTVDGDFNRGWRVDVGGSASVYQVELTEI